jgi:hypothetical protein
VIGFVLEFQVLPVDIVGCFGRPEALDQFASTGELRLRIAPDELLVCGARLALTKLETELARLDVGGVAIDLSSAFSIWALRGEDRFEAFCRLSALELPKLPDFVQGLVAQVPTKVMVREEELLLIVSSVLAHHLRKRLLIACADLEPSAMRAIEAEVPV